MDQTKIPLERKWFLNRFQNLIPPIGMFSWKEKKKHKKDNLQGAESIK